VERAAKQVLIDGRLVAAGTEFVRDVCIIGAGPAGISIVDRLRGSGLSIALLESGGFDPSLKNQKLYRGDNVGHPYFRLDACRFRLFGGSTNRWGGWSRPLDPSDFEQRAWVPNSGWPIDSADLSGYYGDVARLLELPTVRFDQDHWNKRLPPPMALDGSDFENSIFQYSPETNFGEKYRAVLLEDRDVTILLNTNAIEVDLDPGTSRVGGVQVEAIDRPAFTVRAKMFVLATGGLENPRLLLASRQDRTAGLGNEHDVVGRYFMEHLHVPVGHLIADGAARNRGFYRKAIAGSGGTRGVITPTEAARKKHQLLGCSIALEDGRYNFGTPYQGWPPELTMAPVRTMRALRRTRMSRIADYSKTLLEETYNLEHRWETARIARAAALRTPSGPGPIDPASLCSIYFRSEQAPDPESRVTLSPKRDPLGLQRIRLDWRVNRVETDAITSWLDRFAELCVQRHLGTVIRPAEDWADRIIGGPHHMGTTRMSVDPKYGVVDRDCKVHSIENLYIAGSSTFPTGGYANPTFTLIALALRLADRIRSCLV
jgi:choline dehydrogenase-like flavoprotein